MTPDEYARLRKLEALLVKFSTPLPACMWLGHGYAAWFIRHDSGYMQQTTAPLGPPYPSNLYFLPLPRLRDPTCPNNPPMKKRRPGHLSSMA